MTIRIISVRHGCKCGLISLSALMAQTSAAQAQDLQNYSLDDLLTVESTSVARKRQRIGNSAAAVTILTQEDILRSGAQTIPDVLRLVPGVEVGQIDNASTAVSVRGFNTRFANNLLVMIDGRSLYVLALSGVLWDQQLVPLADIERIEVVRGPGATRWGSNAVNGVINIITKESNQSQGWLVDAYASTADQYGMIRYGTSSDTASLRVYATGRTLEALDTEGSSPSDENTSAYQLGFRLDLAVSDNDTLTLQGDSQKGSFVTALMQTPPNVPVSGYYPIEGGFSGNNILGRWSHHLGDNKEFILQAYLDRVSRDEFGVAIKHTMADVDTTIRFAADRHELMVGLNYRLSQDFFGVSKNVVAFQVQRQTTRWLSGFIQHDFWLIPALRLSLGSKFEHNTITGTEVQPSARVLWKLSPEATVWAAYSHAVRTPAGFEEMVQVDLGIPENSSLNPLPYPVVSRVRGSSDLNAEQLDAFEAGVRGHITDRLCIDVAVYANYHRNLIGYELYDSALDTTNLTPALVLDFATSNIARGRTLGIETTFLAAPRDELELQFTYAFKDMSIAVPSPIAGEGLLFTSSGDLSPRHQVIFRVSYDVSARFEIDGWLRHVSALPSGKIPAYSDLDLRIYYALTPNLGISLIGQNLLTKRRIEFAQPQYPAARSYVGRSLAVRLGTKF